MSLEWLTKHNKTIPKPKIVIEELDRYGGFYVSPDRDEFWILDKVYYPRETNGIIVANGKYHEDTAGTLAHEYRHHCQFFNGVKFINWDWIQPDTLEEYEIALIKYFSINFELDALLFQHRVAPTEWSDYVYGLLKNSQYNKYESKS